MHTIEVVVDRLIVGDDADVNRFTDSVEQAINLGSGVVQVSWWTARSCSSPSGSLAFTVA